MLPRQFIPKTIYSWDNSLPRQFTFGTICYQLNSPPQICSYITIHFGQFTPETIWKGFWKRINSHNRKILVYKFILLICSDFYPSGKIFWMKKDFLQKKYIFFIIHKTLSEFNGLRVRNAQINLTWSFWLLLYIQLKLFSWSKLQILNNNNKKVEVYFLNLAVRFRAILD